MTVNNTRSYNTRFGDGTNKSFVFDFDVSSNSDIVVTKIASDGTETKLVQGTGTTNYSVDVKQYPGRGNIIYPHTGSIRLTSGEKILIERKTPLTQDANFGNEANWSPVKIGGAIDNIHRVLIEQNNILEKTPKLPLTSGLTTVNYPNTLQPGRVLQVTADSKGFENGPSANDIANAGSYASQIVDARSVVIDARSVVIDARDEIRRSGLDGKANTSLNNLTTLAIYATIASQMLHALPLLNSDNKVKQEYLNIQPQEVSRKDLEATQLALVRSFSSIPEYDDAGSFSSDDSSDLLSANSPTTEVLTGTATKISGTVVSSHGGSGNFSNVMDGATTTFTIMNGSFSFYVDFGSSKNVDEIEFFSSISGGFSFVLYGSNSSGADTSTQIGSGNSVTFVSSNVYKAVVTLSSASYRYIRCDVTTSNTTFGMRDLKVLTKSGANTENKTITTTKETQGVKSFFIIGKTEPHHAEWGNQLKVQGALLASGADISTATWIDATDYEKHVGDFVSARVNVASQSGVLPVFNQVRTNGFSRLSLIQVYYSRS